MKDNLMKKILLATAIGLFAMNGAFAEDEKAPTPGMMSQAILSEQLVAMGTERNDPLLLIAALRLRATLDDKDYSIASAFTTKDDLIAAATNAAGSREDLKALIDDVSDEKSRMFCYPSWGRTICY